MPDAKYFVGSYSMLPKNAPELEKDYLAGLAALPLCCGLELALNLEGNLCGSHTNDEAWLFSTLKELGALERWQYIITLIPPTMDSIAKDPHFGLASNSVSGRAAAVELGRKACAAVGRLKAAIGSSTSMFVELHSGPTRHSEAAKVAGVKSSPASLVASLKELGSLDWHGVQLVIEHCDWHGGVAPVKGFLSLEEEIEALKMVNADLGSQKVLLTVNWARSVLETHETETAASHITAARKAGLLCGLMFSGCSGVQGPYGQWKDSHMPHGCADGIECFAKGSLLTQAEIRRCYQAAGEPCMYTGAKITAKHVGDKDVAARIGLYRDMLTLMSEEAAHVENADEMPNKRPRSTS